MGATTFEDTTKGQTAADAFTKAVEQADHDYGHSGYTGTICEKDGFVEFTVPDGMTVREFITAIESDEEADHAKYPHAMETLARAHEVYDDKWGPAVCVKVAEGEWLFCGWAST